MDEGTRKTSMRRIKNPDDGSQYVDVKVIDEITFRDPKTQAQEYVFRFNNHASGQRKVHVKRLISSGGGGGGEGREGGDDSGGGGGVGRLDVERIDEFSVTDPKASAQEYTYRLPGNATEPPKHLKTHDVTIHSKADSKVWLRVQRIDEIALSDPKERGQERTFRLDWKDDDESHPSELDTSDSGTSINPPWRLDPFQNIVEVQWKKKQPDPPKKKAQYQVLGTDKTRIQSRWGDGIQNITPFLNPGLIFTPAGIAVYGPTPFGRTFPVQPFPASGGGDVLFWCVLVTFADDFAYSQDPSWPPRPMPPGYAPLPSEPLFFYEQGVIKINAGCAHFSFGQLTDFDSVVIGSSTFLTTRAFLPRFIRGTAGDAAGVVAVGGQAAIRHGDYSYYYITSPSNPALADAICIGEAPTFTFVPNLYYNEIPAEA